MLFQHAAEEVIELEESEMIAVVSGSASLDRFDIAIRAARAKCELAKVAYLSHIREHGC